MHSSIFNFKKLVLALSPSQAIVILLAGLLAYVVSLEVVTLVGMERISRGAKRQHNDYMRALSLSPTTRDGRQTVLIVGNSLLLSGVDQTKLSAAMSPEYSVSYLPIENTTYLDWYFGLRRLFDEGARPSTVVLCLSPRQLTSDAVNGEAFARHMMQLRDIMMVARAANLETTATSAFVFAHFSAWLGDRASIRNWILETWLPHVDLLASSLANGSPRRPDPDRRDSTSFAEQRLDKLREISAAYGTRLLFLVPPLTSKWQGIEEFRRLASEDGVAVLVPYQLGEMATDYFFPDGFHLNPNGAEAFTNRLGPELRSALTRSMR